MEHGDPVDGRFDVLGLAASGGMGAVLRARDRHTGGVVALKIMRQKEASARFAQEARILSELRHPGIVRYVAHGQTDSGEPYLAMEWLDGEDLAQRLAREGVTVGESVELIKRVADALSAAHAHGVVHRDIKPSNLFLCEGRIERIKLLDFGIARLQQSPAGALTRNGTALGTPGYMSPEQVMDSREIDARSDVFSLGCVLFECLTGQPPFMAEDVVALFAKILIQDAPRLCDVRPDLDPALEAVVASMLAKDLASRLPSADAVGDTLSVLDPSGVAPPASVRLQPSQLTSNEQGLLCVVLVSAAGVPSVSSVPFISAENDVPVDIGGQSASAIVRALPRPSGAPPPKPRRVPIERTPELEAIVGRAKGRLERLVNGSAVVTLVGRGAATDLAARAARCALAMRALLPDRPIGLAMGRGMIAKGPPVGEVIDRAARVLRAGIMGGIDDPTIVLPRRSERAPAREPETRRGDRPVHLDDISAALLEARFDVRAGAAGPELVAERKEAEVTRMLLGKPTPCVGRDAELQALSSIFAACAGERRASVVLLTAAAGAGKSRLRAEFLRGIAQRGERVAVLVGYGDPMSAGSPFGMVASALRRAIGVSAGEPEEIRRGKLKARLSKTLRGDTLVYATEFLGELLEIKPVGDASVKWRAAQEDARLMGDLMRQAFQEWLAAECEERPVLIVLEDLQWGDLPTVKLIDAALRVVHGKPLMVLALARPEVHTVFPDLWADHDVREIRLGELSREASEALVVQVLGPATPPALATEIASQAAGNAFYLEELIRAAAEQHRSSPLAVDASAHGRSTPPPRPPGTVIAMVQSRLLELDSEARRLLRAASIFGQVFWRSGVIALLGGVQRTGEIGGWLDDVAERELCVRQDKARFGAEEEYAFRHALVREAAYAMLTDRDRALGHKLAGEWLERAGERDAMVLAEHFERGRAPSGALLWYRRAAEQALEGGDLGAVFERAERAIACGAEDEELGALRLLQGYARQWQGQHVEAEQSARAAMRDLARGSDVWFRAAGAIAMACGRMGKHAELEEVGSEMLSLAASRELTAPVVIAIADACMQLTLAGKHDLAGALHERIERVAVSFVELDPEVNARILQARAYRAYFLDEDREAFLELLGLVVESYERAGDLRSVCLAGSDLGFANLELGAYERAAQVLRRVVEGADRMGLSAAAAAGRENLGMAVARLGQLEEARALEEAAIRAFVMQRERRMEAGARIYLAMIHLLRGDPDGAEREAGAALEVLDPTSSMRIHAIAALAFVGLARGRVDEALSAACDMLSSLEAQKASFESLGDSADAESYIRLAHAEVLHASGDLDGALAAVLTAKERLLARAERIKSAPLRASFLERVPENVRTLALARAWLGGSNVTYRG